MGEVSQFSFEGGLPASKSIMNRLLNVRAYEPGIDIVGASDCDDVVVMKRAVDAIVSGVEDTIGCGAAGTTFRFCALLASRRAGTYVLTGTPRLLARPHQGLIDLLAAFGSTARLTERSLTITSSGWSKPSGPVDVDRKTSSQFATALLLNAWNLPFDVDVRFRSEDALSEGYFQMTIRLVRDLGLRLETVEGGLRILAGSKPEPKSVRAEMDASSAFAVASLGAIGGKVVLHDFPFDGVQPDIVFTTILAKMGAGIARRDHALSVSMAQMLNPVDVNLADCPDLFPVLATLCAFADGTSNLTGAPHLVAKESNRIAATAKLLRTLGRDVKTLTDGMVVHGRPVLASEWKSKPAWDFDPEDDHRLAMAVALANVAGAPIRCLHPDVVDKSFPGFWHLFRQGGGQTR